jgi:hypothetical protein
VIKTALPNYSLSFISEERDTDNRRYVVDTYCDVNSTRAIARKQPIATIEKLLGAVFSGEPAPGLYIEDPRQAALNELYWKFSKVHTDPRFGKGFSHPYVYNYIKKIVLEKKQTSHKSMTMNMFAVYDNMKSGIENIRSLHLVVVELTIVQATMLPL